MEKVTHIKTYTYIRNNERLSLLYGRVTVDGKIMSDIRAQRWAVVGLNIPFPVRSGSWFEGFNFAVMNEYLQNAGYALTSEANVLMVGHIKVYNHSQKGNESSQKGNQSFYDSIDNNEQYCIDMAIKALRDSGNMELACGLCEITYGISVDDAAARVRSLYPYM